MRGLDTYTTHDTSANTDSIGSQLFRSFADPEYRRIYADEYLSTLVAFQIRAIREQRGWTQAELGERCGGKAQGWISKLEDPTYGKFTITTLKAVADAFDGILEVRIKSFKLHADEQGRRTPGDLRVNTYDEDVEASKPPVTHVESDETSSIGRLYVEDVAGPRKRMAKSELPSNRYVESPTAATALHS